jgi:nickel/cobalt exporter
MPNLAFAGLGAGQPGAGEPAYRLQPSPALSRSAATPAFVCDAAHEHGPGCGHFHAPDPTTLGEDFSWREAVATVVTAGARPCSGAILVLVFALAQGMFYAGIAATLTMAFGTAIVTAALAATAVLAKTVALKLTGAGSRRGALVGRAFEVAAAALVFAVGVSLLLGVGPLQALS